MTSTKTILLTLVALLSISFAFAWLDPPSADEKAYFSSSLKNMSEKEFGGFGVAIGSTDLQVSIYVYKHETLSPDGWSMVFKSAFATNPSNWTDVYDYVIYVIQQSDYYETYGYLHINNVTYWLNNVGISDNSLSADLALANSTVSAGTVSLTPLFWSFWTGSADIDGTSYKIVLLKNKN